jgi:hypothetical protein
LERGTQVPHTVRGRVVGVVRENFKQASANDLFALRHRGLEVALVHGYDGELAIQQQVVSRSGIENGSVVISHGMCPRHVLHPRCWPGGPKSELRREYEKRGLLH